METLQAKLGRERICSESGFDRWIFWQCLYRHALPLAPLILLLHADYFRSDRELIRRVRRAETVNRVWQEVGEFHTDPDHEARWWHQRAKVRISGERLIALARRHLPHLENAPPCPPKVELERRPASAAG